MTAEILLSRYGTSVPRYTSYPTAPHFHSGIDNRTYAEWLLALQPGQSLSLYLHIPYCDRLCWFCACHTKQTRRYAPVTTYLTALAAEIEAVGRLVDPGAVVTSVHWGGGSPTMLKPGDMRMLMATLRRHFTIAPDAEISVEMDPNDLDAARYDALAEIGMTRASLGIQDFDPAVQQAINRIQTFDQTRAVIEAVRARGVRSVNCDLLYGLPHQTEQRLQTTLDAVLSLAPDRIALFGYAHVPWMKKHQTMIPDESLPDAVGRFAQMQGAAARLVAAGYQAIGIDHFARPGDGLALAALDGRLRRNFQGYTADGADALIGLGASAISRFPQGYVQTTAATGEYQRQVLQASGGDDAGLAVQRGLAFSTDDRLRARVIEDLMCRFRFSLDGLRRDFGEDAAPVLVEARRFVARNPDRLAVIEAGEFRLTADGRLFARSVAAVFDRYLATGAARHSLAV